jgi:hypothetical protein
VALLYRLVCMVEFVAEFVVEIEELMAVGLVTVGLVFDMVLIFVLNCCNPFLLFIIFLCFSNYYILYIYINKKYK